LIELGIPNFSFSLWAGYFGPPGTPEAVVQRINKEVLAAFELPDVKTKMVSAGADFIRTTPAEFTAFMRAESQKYELLIKQIGYKGE